MNFTIALVNIILCINLNNYISIRLEKSLLTQYNDKAQTAKKNRDFVPTGTKIGHAYSAAYLVTHILHLVQHYLGMRNVGKFADFPINGAQITQI